MGRIPNRQAVFFELEGVLIQPHEPRDTTPVFYDRALDALQRFDQSRLDLVIATNQSGIAFGQIRERDFKELRDNLLHTLAQNGVHIARFYFCPFHPRGKGKWRKESVFRKPNTGASSNAISSVHPNGSQFSICDGSVKWVNSNADGKLLDYIADRADGGTVVWD